MKVFFHVCLSSKIFVFSPKRSIFLNLFIKIYTHIPLSPVNCVSKYLYILK